MSGDNCPSLSIVIVNSDGIEDTLNCIASIYQNPPEMPFEVILVDNCSKISPFTTISNQYPKVRQYSATKRQGFAKNYNVGIRKSRGEYILIINNDTLVCSGALNKLINEMNTNNDYAIVGPKLLSVNGEIQTVCARPLITPVSYVLIQFLLDLALPTGRLWDKYRRWRLSRSKSGPVQCISGACMMISHQALNQIGFLDEDYDFYYEDVEWCHRVQKHNLLVAYISEAEVTHIGDQSLSKVKEWAKKSEYNSAIRYFHQYHNIDEFDLLLLWVVTVLSFSIRAFFFTLFGARMGKQSYAEVYRNLFRWIITQYPVRVKSI